MSEVGKVERYYSVVVSADVYEAEKRPVQYAARELSYQPKQIEVTYNWTSEDTEQTAHVQIFGKLLLKDGTEGRRKHEMLWTKDEWPQWVKDFVVTYRPPTEAVEQKR